MLRWWWRFLGLGRFETAERASYWEAMLFGWHSREFGRKRVSFRLEKLIEGAPAPWRANPQINMELNKWSGISYLTAQGFKERDPALVRAFTVEAKISDRGIGPPVPDWALRPGQSVSDEWQLAKDALIDAVALIGLLGGLGARSRRGFGSMAIECLVVDSDTRISGLPADVTAYGELVDSHLRTDRAPGQPPYSAYCDGFRYDICAKAGDARKLMNDIGWAFQIYRSWGQRRNRDDPGQGHVHRKTADGQVQEIPAGTAKTWYRPAFRDDHNNFYARGANGYGSFPDGVFDNRAVFGLPHNYGGKQVGWDFGGQNETAHHRRASPLLFHFHRLANLETVFLASVIPAQFTPNNARLRVGPNLRMAINPQIDFDHLTDFAAFLRDGPDGMTRVPETDFTALP